MFLTFGDKRYNGIMCEYEIINLKLDRSLLIEMTFYVALAVLTPLKYSVRILINGMVFTDSE